MAEPPLHSFPPPGDSGAEIQGDDDDTLMAAVSGGDREAFATLVQRYGRRLLKYTTKITASNELGLALATETWLGVWGHRGRYPGDGQFIPFILTIAKRKAASAPKAEAGTPVPEEVGLDEEALLAEIFARLDDPEVQRVADVEAARATMAPRAAREARRWRWVGIAAGAIVVAACLFFVIRAVVVSRGSGAANIAKDVKVVVYATPGPKPIEDGAKVDKKTDFSAAYTSSFPKRAYVLVFAVDAAKDVHWIAPAFTDPTESPPAIELERNDTETPLRSPTELPAITEGRLSVYAIVTEDLLRVSDIEGIPSAERTSDRLRTRFARGTVREWKLVVVRK